MASHVLAPVTDPSCVESVETASCIECSEAVAELSGWETTSGKVLCEPCFVILHGAKTARRLGSAARPSAVSRASRFFWLTGADGEVIRTNAFTLVDGPGI